MQHVQSSQLDCPSLLSAQIVELNHAEPLSSYFKLMINK